MNANTPPTPDPEDAPAENLPDIDETDVDYIPDADEVAEAGDDPLDPAAAYDPAGYDPANFDPAGYEPAPTVEYGDQASPAPQPNPAVVFVPAEKPKRNRAGLGLIAVAAVAALVGGVSGAGATLWAVNAISPSGTPTTLGPSTVTINNPGEATLVSAIAAASGPSVVTIDVTGGSSAGSGSGVIISEDGYIVTNTHVVTLQGASGDNALRVQAYDGRLYDATLIGTDPLSDLAVIKLDNPGTLQPIRFADSNSLNVGDVAVAIGAPLGLANTVTNGIVSALNRSITVASSAVPDDTDDTDDRGEESPFDFWEFDLPGQNQSSARSRIFLPVIQTDAAINPGNSGGALLNADGNLIGVNVAIATAGSSGSTAGSIGVGFAIPANLVKRITDEIIADGAATHGLLGATVTDAATDQNLAEKTVVGASIVDVTRGGAAEGVGLKVGDVIVTFNGLPITGSTDLTAQVRAVAAGATVTLSYLRDGQVRELTVTVGELTDA